MRRVCKTLDAGSIPAAASNEEKGCSDAVAVAGWCCRRVSDELMARAPGYIRKRGDTWEVIVELDPDPLTGRRRRKYATAKSEKAAHRLRAKLVTDAADGTAQAPERRTVKELSEAWLAHIEANRSPSTMIGYRNKIDRYIVPNLGRVRLDRLKAIQLDGLYATLRASGGEDGGALSAQTVRHVHAILHAMLTQARRWGWIVRNPAEDATAPASAPAKVKVPTPEQVSTLYEAAIPIDRNLALAIWLCAVVGPRRGEVCALRWPDIEGRRLLVSASLVVVGKGEMRIKSTKTEKVRRVSLDPFTMRLLAKHRHQARIRAVACSVDLIPEGYILSESASGADPLHPDVLSKRFQRLAEKLEIDCHLHLLRHYHDTMALAAGIPPRIVAGRAGHDTRQVLERYGHFLEQSDAEAASVLAGTLRRTGSDSR